MQYDISCKSEEVKYSETLFIFCRCMLSPLHVVCGMRKEKLGSRIPRKDDFHSRQVKQDIFLKIVSPQPGGVT